MSSVFSEFALAEQLALSYLVGRAGGSAVEPLLVGIRQSAYVALLATGAFEVPPALFLAEGVAQGQIDPKTAALWASYQGFGQAQFDAMVAIANTGPPLGMAMDAWRRGLLSDGNFQAALNRAGIEPMWYSALEGLKAARLTPEQVAVLVQRSVIPNQGELPFSTDIPQGNVPPMPQVAIDGYAEAAAHGYDSAQVDALTRIIGLPASPDLAARMTYRGIITKDDFTRAIAEGNTRQEWAPFLFEGFRQIPTAEQFVEAHLRGWIDAPTMYAGTARWGMSQPDTDLEYQIHRRPLTPHAIKQALARGGTFNPQQGELTDPYEASVHQANLGPEWYDLAIALAGSYPSLFITNRLVTSGVISATTGEDWLRKAGLADEVVAAMVTSWGGAGGATADPHVTKAQTQLWGTLHKSYVADETDDATATTMLGRVGVAAGAIPAVLALWADERSLVRKQLTPAQIKKAYKGSDTNPATGAAWTFAEAQARLISMGYSSNDATTFLEE